MALLAKTFGCCRFVYNRMLEDKIKHYQETKENVMPGLALYCPKDGDMCELYFFDKKPDYPLDSEQSLLYLFEFKEGGAIQDKRIYIFVIFNPCMICSHLYDVFLQKYTTVSIDVFYKKYNDSKDIGNTLKKYDLTKSRIYKGNKQLSDEYQKLFGESPILKIPSLVFHNLGEYNN